MSNNLMKHYAQKILCIYNGKIIYLCIFVIGTLNTILHVENVIQIFFFSLYFSILHVFIICYVFNYILEFAILMYATKIVSISNGYVTKSYETWFKGCKELSKIIDNLKKKKLQCLFSLCGRFKKTLSHVKSAWCIVGARRMKGRKVAYVLARYPRVYFFTRA